MLDETAFDSPPRTDRGGPLWVWNDTMETEHLETQIGEMAAEGWGAFFIHPRVGLEVDYLSEEWMEKVHHSVETALEAGIDPWLYDEDRWPSGYASGHVPSRGPEYTVRSMAVLTNPAPDDVVVDAVERNGEMRYFCVRIGDDETYATAQINGEGYADLLNPDAVTEFLESTYEAYDDAVGEYFGDGVPGIFTDEPHVYFEPFGMPEEMVGYVPWTVGLPTIFANEYDYDLLDHLPCLFYDENANGRDYRSVRYDFWRLINRRYVETYTKRLYEWCEDRDLQLTGHFMHEDSIGRQISATGAVMPHYEFQHQPGVDCLGRTHEGYGNDLTLKQCASVARQFDRIAMSELYGCSGQQFSFETRKWLADWHLAHDVTFLNPHLSLYSMRGERKRDFPPNIFYQQPWWEYNDRMTEYLARITHALRLGTPASDTLVLHPVRTGWLEYSAVEPEPVETLDDRFTNLLDDLLRAHVPFDLGDERILSRHGEVPDSADDPSIRVAEASYDTVVVPYCETLETDTVALLEEFVAAGGKVLQVGDPPDRLEGRRAPEEFTELVAEINAVARDDLVDRLPRPIRLRGDAGAETAPSVRVHARRLEDGLVVFLANTDRDAAVEFTLELPGQGRLTRWNAVDGTSEPIAAESENGQTCGDVTLPETGSMLVTLDESQVPADTGGSLGRHPTGTSRSLPSTWSLERDEPNQLVLDECDLVLDGEELGWTNVAKHWPDETSIDDPETHVPFAATYRFDVAADVAAGTFEVVIESADEQRVTFNGTDLDETEDRWRDVHWHRLDVTDLVTPGTNELVLEGTRSATVGVEPIYVLGEFAVNDEHRLVDEPEAVDPADVTDQGYPFYTGELAFETTLSLDESIEGVLSFGDVHATLLSVRVDGADPYECYWPPWEVPISLDAGDHAIEVRLVTSLRNLTGPHHSPEVEPVSMSPDTFRHPAVDENERDYIESGEWYDGYHVVPVGFEEPRVEER